MRNENEFKELVAENLAYYRKVNNLTQLQLAEKLNYSDKSISKWERGESLPDIYILYTITELFGITLNDLTKKKKTKIKKIRIKSRTLITLLSFGLCWLIATIVYVLLGIFFPTLTKTWLAFIYAIPASMIVLIVFSKLWTSNIVLFLSTSILFWTIPLSIYLSFNYDKLWLLFITGIPLQILTILWFTLRTDLNKQKSISEE